jgi:hypothetical protein
MAKLRFSPETIKATQRVADLSQTQYDGLVSSLSQIAPAASSTGLVKQLTPLISGVPSEVLSETIEMIFALSCSRVSNDLTLAEFLKDVSESLVDVHPDNESSSQQSIKRIVELLSHCTVIVSAKAFVLQREHQRILVKSRVISDCRPVFGHDPDVVLGNVISHMLKISYIENMERREFFVALDDQDLNELQERLTRAQFKTKEISTLMGKSGIGNIPA